jgi:hypothetical protein
VKKHLASEAAARAPATSLNVISFYRHHVCRYETAARHAPNEKLRAQLSKMVHVWREFAAEHERMVSKGSDFNVRLYRSLKGWM